MVFFRGRITDNLILNQSYPRNTIVNSVNKNLFDSKKERKTIMKNEMKTTKEFSPYNVKMLVTVATAPNFEVEYDTRTGKPIAYHTPFRPIKALLENPWYDKLRMKDKTLAEAFDALQEVYTKEGNSERAKRLYKKFQANIRAYNQELIDRITPHLFVNQADKKLDAVIWHAKQNFNQRWADLRNVNASMKPYKYYDSLSEEDREIRLARATDLGVYSQDYVGYARTKEFYTFQQGEIAEPAEQPTPGDSLHWLRPFDTYHKVGDKGYEGIGLISVAGKYTVRDMFKRHTENEAMAIADLMEELYGDEFLMTTTTPEGVVTRRDIRLGLVEDEPLEWYDFLSPLHEDESEIEDDSNIFEDILDEESESEEPEEGTYYSEIFEDYEEDELDYMNGTEL